MARSSMSTNESRKPGRSPRISSLGPAGTRPSHRGGCAAGAPLLQVVGALHPVGGLADLLHRGQQEADQDRDDRNHDEQLDQCKAWATRGEGRRHNETSATGLMRGTTIIS